MEAIDVSHHVVRLEEGACRSTVLSSGTSDLSDDEHRCSSTEFGDEIVGVVGEKGRGSSASVCSVDDDDQLDQECGVQEVKVQLEKVERDCRICHLSMDATNHESGIPIELGCCCKEDLAAAHKECAEAWFKIKGNKTCEICGSTAQNVSGVNETELIEQWNESNNATMASSTTTAAPSTETRNFWQGHHFLNFLLACMVFAFVISWLFHFNVPS